MYKIYLKNPKNTDVTEAQGEYNKYLLYETASALTDVYGMSLTVELGKAGSLSFTLPPSHPNYNDLTPLVSIIDVYKNDSILWRGRVINISRDMSRSKKVVCEGVLAWLGDFDVCFTGGSDYNRATDPSTAYGHLFSVIYNDRFSNIYRNWYRHLRSGNYDQDEDMGDEYHGVSAVIDGTDQNSLYIFTTSDRINRFTDKYNGYLLPRYDNDTTYIDFSNKIDEFELCSQTIEFGKNLISLDEYIDGTQICTAIVVYGNAREDLTYNGEYGRIINGSYIITLYGRELDLITPSGAQALLDKYGYITHKINVDLSDRHSEGNLIAGAKYHARREYAKNLNRALSINISAVDLSLLNVDAEEIKVGQRVHIKSAPHCIDEILLCSKIVYDFENPANNQYVIGKDDISLTGKLYNK